MPPGMLVATGLDGDAAGVDDGWVEAGAEAAGFDLEMPGIEW